jgi:Mg2+-importing ATPase
MITKGAVEEIISICAYYEDGDSQKKITDDLYQQIKTRVDNLNKDGLRVIALAIKNEDKSHKNVFTINDEKI